jgi:GH24 family phage-related lysozyme (muramidase)
LKQGDYNADVVRLKESLRLKGYWPKPLPMDPTYGWLLARQVRKLQKNHGLAPTGIADQKVWQLLAWKAPTGISSKGVDFIKDFEGCDLKPVHNSFDPPGVWTIGYGHIENVGPNTPAITVQQATELLKSDLDKHYAPYVSKLNKRLLQHQFDALVSAVYNLGPGILNVDRTLGHALRFGTDKEIANAFQVYVNGANGPLPGLVRRRKAEARLYQTANYSTEIQ